MHPAREYEGPGLSAPMLYRRVGIARKAEFYIQYGLLLLIEKEYLR